MFLDVSYHLFCHLVHSMLMIGLCQLSCMDSIIIKENSSVCFQRVNNKKSFCLREIRTLMWTNNSITCGGKSQLREIMLFEQGISWELRHNLLKERAVSVKYTISEGIF